MRRRRAGGRSPRPSLPPSPRPSGTDGFPRRVPGARRAASARAAACRRGSQLAEGARVVLMSDRRGVARRWPEGCEKRGVEVLSDLRHADRRGDRHAGRALARRRPDRRRLLAARPRRRAAARRARPRGLARRPAPARQAARRPDARWPTVARGTFLVSATRLGGRHGYDDAGATSVDGRRGDRLHQGARARARRARWSRPSTSRPDRKTTALADLLIEETLRDPGAVEVGHADDLRWTVGLVERPAQARPGRARCPNGRPSSRHRRRRQHRLGDHRRPGRRRSGGTFHLLDLVAAPDRDDPDLASASSPTRTGSRASWPSACKDARRAPDAEARSSASWPRIERARAALDAIEAIERGRRHSATGTRST